MSVITEAKKQTQPGLINSDADSNSLVWLPLITALIVTTSNSIIKQWVGEVRGTLWDMSLN